MIERYVRHKLRGQEFLLLPEKSLFWVQKEILILSDIHIGKAGHFRKKGIPISNEIHFREFFIMDALINELKPKELVFLGDLFHSDLNREWEDFYVWANGITKTNITLVKGNHDRLADSMYLNSNMTLVDHLEIDDFLFYHIPEESNDKYVISGHIHPCVRLKGKARQSITLPAFIFREQYALLPAFGNFTGGGKVRLEKSDHVYAVVESSVVKLL